jgi:hypothetical protein
VPRVVTHVSTGDHNSANRPNVISLDLERVKNRNAMLIDDFEPISDLIKRMAQWSGYIAVLLHQSRVAPLQLNEEKFLLWRNQSKVGNKIRKDGRLRKEAQCSELVQKNRIVLEKLLQALFFRGGI